MITRGKRKLSLFLAVLLAFLSVSTAGVFVRTEKAEAADGVYTVLIIGSDRRDGGWDGNSDTMILLTVNHNVHKVFMVSFMRDLYANIPGYGGRKLNAAYALGGAPLLISTLQSNYGVTIDNYIALDFNSVVRVVDSMGGVDLVLDEADAAIVGMPAGAVHLNGSQALLYMRNRSVGRWDYQRTARQRAVLSSLYSKVDKSNVVGLISLISNVLGMVTGHNLSAANIPNLASMVSAAGSYSLVTDRVPFDGTFYSQNEILIPYDMGGTAARICGMLYEGGAAPALPAPVPVEISPEAYEPLPELAAPSPELAAPSPETAAPSPEAAAPSPEAAAPSPEAAESVPAVEPAAAVAPDAVDGSAAVTDTGADGPILTWLAGLLGGRKYGGESDNPENGMADPAGSEGEGTQQIPENFWAGLGTFLRELFAVIKQVLGLLAAGQAN